MCSVMKKLSRVFAAVLTLTLPLITMAHPGHDHAEGNEGFTITHYLTSPVHIITSLAVIAVVVGIVRAVKNQNQKT